jgi:tetratricopeptide (TPR) repeat protein
MYSGVCLLAADRQLAVTREMLDQGKVAEAAAAYARARAWESPGVNADLWYSRRMLEASRTAPVQFSVPVWRQAREAAIRAPQTAEDVQNAWYNLAMFYAAENKAAETEESLRKAIAAAPNWFKPHWVLARLLQAAGRIPEAREEAERAAALNGGDAEVARTLAEVRAAAGVR